MNEVDALDLMRMALATVLLASAPAVGAAMLVGVVVALFQALTQIQEATLTFVPKIIAVFVANDHFSTSDPNHFTRPLSH